MNTTLFQMILSNKRTKCHSVITHQENVGSLFCIDNAVSVLKSYNLSNDYTPNKYWPTIHVSGTVLDNGNFKRKKIKA